MEVFRLEGVQILMENLFFDVSYEIFGKCCVYRRCLVYHPFTVDDVMEAFADVEVYDRAAKDVSRVVQCQLDVWSHISHNIVPQWDGMRHDFSDVLLVEGRVFSFSTVNVEVVELV